MYTPDQIYNGMQIVSKNIAKPDPLEDIFTVSDINNKECSLLWGENNKKSMFYHVDSVVSLLNTSYKLYSVNPEIY